MENYNAMPSKENKVPKKIKKFFKEYNTVITCIIAIGGALYGAGYWSANIINSIKQNELTQRFNEEISSQKLKYDEMIRQIQIENDNLRHQNHLLELNYKRLENEIGQNNKNNK